MGKFPRYKYFTMFQGTVCERKTLVLISLVVGFGLVALVNLPVTGYTEESVVAYPSIDLAATPLTQSMQSARAWQPTQASKFLQPTTRMQSLTRAHPPTSPEKPIFEKALLDDSKKVFGALEKKELSPHTPVVEKNLIRKFLPSLAAAVAIVQSHPAHADAEFIGSVAFMMFGMSLLGVLGGLLLLRFESWSSEAAQ